MYHVGCPRFNPQHWKKRRRRKKTLTSEAQPLNTIMVLE
jgi:hypothetical protein